MTSLVRWNFIDCAVGNDLRAFRQWIWTETAPFTLRELSAMAEARQRAEWDRAAMLCALLVNVNRDPRRGKPAEPEDFNPYRQKRPQCIKLDRSETMRILRDFARNGGAL